MNKKTLAYTQNPALSFAAIKARFIDYGILVKFKLNLTVVFSALFGYLMAKGFNVGWIELAAISLGGFLVTSSANTINQILEKEYDKLMNRTASRPLAKDRIGVGEAVLISGICGVSGILLLWYNFNQMAALLGAIALISYAFIYTPLKRYSPIAVLVGAIPGALPPAIGYVAASNQFGIEAYSFFAIQFLWQFPHFWAIGWLAYDDYKNAGFKLMPIHYDARNRATAIQMIIFTMALIIVSLWPWFLGMTGGIAMGVNLIMGFIFLAMNFRLLMYCDQRSALLVMLTSVIYLPVVQIAMVLDKVG